MAAEEAGARLVQAVAFPVGTDVLTLARAWFPAAQQVAAPVLRPQRLVGARFSPRVAAPAVSGPGLHRLTPEARLRGPQGRSAVAAPLPAGLDEVYLVEADGDDAVVTSWLLAAARRSGGALVDGTGQVLVPPVDEFVGLTVYSRSVVPGETTLARARSVAPMMRAVGPVAPDAYRLAFPTPYDGTVTVDLTTRAELPVALGAVEPAAYGRHAYAITWVPEGPGTASPSSVVGRIARDRVVPRVVRLAVVLQEATGGTVVDTGGFVVSVEELRERGSR